MKNNFFKILISAFLSICFTSLVAQQYYPGADWQVKKPAELKMNSKWVDSAISFALHNENKVNRNLRIANLEAYANEPFYRIAGPVKQRGAPAGMIIKNGYIVGQWGDVTRVDMDFSATKAIFPRLPGLL